MARIGERLVLGAGDPGGEVLPNRGGMNLSTVPQSTSVGQSRRSRPAPAAASAGGSAER
jgi:hypothetical protein